MPPSDHATDLPRQLYALCEKQGIDVTEEMSVKAFDLFCDAMTRVLWRRILEAALSSATIDEAREKFFGKPEHD